MKTLNKIAVAALMAGMLALSACGSGTEAAAKPSASETAVSPSATAPAEPVPAAPAPADFNFATPMGQDIAALNANTSSPEVYDYYSAEEFQKASTVGLNFIEQVMSVDSMFANNRVLTEDGVRLQNFFDLFVPESADLINSGIAEKGAVNMLPFADNDGKIPATRHDGTATFMPLKWDNKAPETKWRDVSTSGKLYENGAYGIAVYAVGDHTAINDKGEEETLSITHEAVLYPSPEGKWQMYEYKWAIEKCDTDC